MEKLELKKENDLRIYCFSILQEGKTQFSPFANPGVVEMGKFYLGYSLDDVRFGVRERYGDIGFDIVLHGDVSFQEMVSKVNLVQLLKGMMVDPLSVIPKPQASAPAQEATAEVGLEQFVNRIRLVADRFVTPADKDTLLDILNRVDTEKRS